MTFTEAAIEVLRRAGKPLHFKDIASEAVSSGLLSHVGQTPEATMGSRLLAMARREHDRRVMAVDAGVFALAEWGLSHEPVALEKTQVEEARDEAEPPLRPKERHPSPQDEYVVGARRGEERRRREEDEAGRKKKKYPPPAEVAHQWLREHGQSATLADLAQALRANDRIAEALERDLRSFERALQEENRRRTDSRRPPLFQFEDGKVTALELPKEAPRERPAKVEKPRREEVRPTGVDEQRRNAMRSVRRRIQALDMGAIERVASAFLEATGFRELNMTRRTKEGALYLARHKWGAGELRYAIRILKPGRDLGRQDVQDVRRDLAHYSAQLGVVIGTGECTREAKSESNAPNTAPVMLYGGEALAEALVDAGLGVQKRMVEWVEYDDDFFTSMGGEPVFPTAESEPVVEAAAPAPEAPEEPREERSRRGRDRRRDRRPREEHAPAEAETTEAPAEEAAPSAPEPAAAEPAEGEPSPAPVEQPAAASPSPEQEAPPEVAAVPESAPAEPAPAGDAPAGEAMAAPSAEESPSTS